MSLQVIPDLHKEDCTFIPVTSVTIKKVQFFLIMQSMKNKTSFFKGVYKNSKENMIFFKNNLK